MKISDFCYKIFDVFKRLISPPFCVNCRLYLDDYTVFCTDCLLLIKPVVSKDLPLNSRYKLTVLAVSEYKDPLRYLVLYKFKNSLSFAVQLAQIIWALSNLKNIKFDYLVPIPLHWTRKMWRGYNQSEVIAHELSKLSGRPVFNCLKRVKRTQYQATLTADERQKNLSKAFELDESYQDDKYSGKVFVLVDDVMTTGSTLESAGKVLIKYRPQALYAIVACRVC
jgi:ComF family protein